MDKPETPILTHEHVLRINALNSMMSAAEALISIDEEATKDLLVIISKVHAGTEPLYN